GRVLRDGSRSDSVPALGSLVLAGPWPTDATWLRIVADQPVVAQATVSSAAGGIATIPAVGEGDGGAGYALDGTEDGAVLIAVPVLDGPIDVVPAPEGSWRLVASAPAKSSAAVRARSGIQPLGLGDDPCFPYAPISVGQTLPGFLEQGDCAAIE